MSTQGLFFSSVKVYLAEFPYETITTTGPNGYFTLNNLCDDDQLVFDKSRYTSETVEVRTMAGNVTLQGKGMRRSIKLLAEITVVFTSAWLLFFNP